MNGLKSELLAAVQAKVEEEWQALQKALQDTSAAATDPDSKAEGKYDTRSLEMSYLAAGQARQAEELTSAREQLQRFVVSDFAITDAISLGALVEVDRSGDWEHYWLLPVAGGIEVECQGFTVTTLTPESPLYTQLEGKRIGESAGEGLLVSEVS